MKSDIKVFFEDVEELCKRLAGKMSHCDDRIAILKLADQASAYSILEDDPTLGALDGIAEVLHV